MKNTGLADSPFFKPLQPEHNSVQSVAPLSAKTSVQMFIRSNEHLNEGANEDLNARTDEQMNRRANEHSIQASDARITRRQSFDIYEDQIEAMEQIGIRWRKQRHKYVTKSEVIRELLDRGIKTESAVSAEEQLNK